MGVISRTEDRTPDRPGHEIHQHNQHNGSLQIGHRGLGPRWHWYDLIDGEDIFKANKKWRA
jgi:hypothetical protein